MTTEGTLSAPPTPLEEARGEIRYFDSLNRDEVAERGVFILARAQACALVSIAESLEQLAGESFRRELR